MKFGTEAFQPTVENNPNPDFDWDKINETIREIFAKDDEEIQKKAQEDAEWLENYQKEQSKIGIAIKERQKEEQKTEEEEEARKLKQEEEEEKRNIRAREILKELIEKMERQRREENDPVLRLFKKMFDTYESGHEKDIEKRQD